MKRISTHFLTTSILLLTHIGLHAQNVFTQLKPVFLTEGIIVDCHTLSKEMSDLLTPNEATQPARIKQLEKKLNEAHVSERQAIAKELVPLQQTYVINLMNNHPGSDALVINMAELCYYVYLSGADNYLGYYEKACKIAMQANKGDLLAGYFALRQERLLQNPCLVLGDYYLSYKDFQKAELFYNFTFPINPLAEGELWNYSPDNYCEIFDYGSRYLYKSLTSYPLIMNRLAEVSQIKNANNKSEIMTEAFLAAADIIHWSLLRDDIQEQERLLEILTPAIRQQYNNGDTRWAYNAALFMKNASTYAYLDLKKIYVAPIDLSEWGGYRISRSNWEIHHPDKSYDDYLAEEASKIRKWYPYSNYQKYLDAKARTLKDNTPENIKAQADIYEKLLRDAQLYYGYLASIKQGYNNIHKSLSKGSCAIEFVRTRNIQTDKDEYHALVLRYDTPVPYRVYLCTEQELLDLYQAGANIYRSQMSESTLAYDLIWSNIEKVTQDIDTIFFAPDGLLMSMSIENIIDPSNGHRIYEKKYIHRVSSTKEICLKTKELKFDKAILYGGLNYGTSIREMVKLNKEHEGYVNASRLYRSEGDEVAWSSLPGTKTEVFNIQDILKNHSVDVTVKFGKNGTEEDFKSLSGQTIPILHIATHGFFQTSYEATEGKYYQDMLSRAAKMEYNPMKRSGLILAGANNAWTGKKLPSNIEDGILLSAEIAAIDLSNTSLLVLSACDTGLGQITAEGINGLQKAFKRAGVNNMILAVAKVHDKATQIFMTTFYQYLAEGYTVYQSFQLARATMMESENYSDPSYWAPFILIE